MKLFPSSSASSLFRAAPILFTAPLSATPLFISTFDSRLRISSSRYETERFAFTPRAGFSPASYSRAPPRYIHEMSCRCAAMPFSEFSAPLSYCAFISHAAEAADLLRDAHDGGLCRYSRRLSATPPSRHLRLYFLRAAACFAH